MLPTDGQEENTPKQYNDQDKKFAIWVGNLSQTCTEQEVTEFFGQNCGTVRSIKMLNGRGKQYENSKYCFINFASQHAQEKACEFDEKPLFGSRVTIRKRSEQKKFATLFIGNLHRVSSKEQLKEEFLKLGAPGYEKMELKDGNKYVFVYFKNQHEANMFYDHLQGKSINGVVLAENFPFSKIERQAINAGVHKDKIHRTKRTVFLGSLSENVTEDDIRDFCKDYGLIEDVKKPKYKRGVAFVEFARKTDADKFVEKFGGKHDQAIVGSGFEAGLARLNTGMAMQPATLCCIILSQLLLSVFLNSQAEIL